MAKFCNRCGAQMDDNMMFCSNCGNRVDGAAPVGAPTQAPMQAPVQAPMFGGKKIDFVAILKGKAEPKMNWISALGAQVLAVLLFFLPIVVAKASGYGMSYSESAGMFKALDGSPFPVAIPIIFLIVTIAAIAFMALPLIQKTELKALNAAVMLGAQALFFILNIIAVLVMNGEAKDMSSGMMSVGFSFGGWMYIIFSLVALYFVGMIVYYNKDQLIKKNTPPTYNNFPNDNNNYYQ